MKHALSTVLFLLLLLLVLSSQAQDRKLDSLVEVLKTAKEDTNKVLLLDDISVKYQNAGKQDKSIAYAEEGLKLAEKLKFPRGTADIYNDLSNTYYFKGDYDKAIYYQSLAIPIRIQLKQEKKLGKSYNNLSAFYMRKGDFAKALDYNLKSLAIKEKLKDSLGVLRGTSNAGNLYYELKNIKMALSYYTKAYALAKKINDPEQLSMALDHLSAIALDEGKYEQALDYAEQSLATARQAGNRYMIGVNYSNMGTIYLKLEKPGLAVESFQKALKMWEEDENEDGIQSVSLKLGQFYTAQKDHKNAIKYLERSLKNTQHRKELANTYKTLAALHKTQGDLSKAYQYFELHNDLRDSIYTEESAVKIAEMQTRYETEKKEKENIALKRKTELQALTIKNEAEKRKTIVITGIALLILTIVTAAFFYYRRKLRQEALLAAEVANQEKLRFRAIIEAEEKERSRIAQDLHDGLGQMLAASRMHVIALQNNVAEKDKQFAQKASEILNDAYQEVRSISHNMMPHALMRLGLVPAIRELVNNINTAGAIQIDFSTNLEGSLEKNMDITIYRIIQEVLNNMIKHAQADHIVMKITRSEDSLGIHISDNGIGFDTSRINESKGLGWKGIFSRVSMLEGTIKLDSKPREGTIIYINLKLKNEVEK